MSSSKQSNKLLLMLPIASPVEYVIQKYRNFFFSLHTSWLSWNKPFAWPTCWASHIVAEAHSTSSRHSRRLGLRCWSAKINKIWILEKWDTNWQPQGRPVTFVRHQKSDFFFLAQVNILGMLIWPISYLNFRPEFQTWGWNFPGSNTNNLCVFELTAHLQQPEAMIPPFASWPLEGI